MYLSGAALGKIEGVLFQMKSKAGGGPLVLRGVCLREKKGAQGGASVPVAPPSAAPDSY